MRRMKMMCGLLLILLFTAHALEARGKPDGAFQQDESAHNMERDLVDTILTAVGTDLHFWNGSYTLVPAPGWRFNQYSGLLIDSFRVDEGLWLMNGLFYSNYRTTRDENFPEKLHKLADHILLHGNRFQVYASVSSKSDLLFRNFKSVNINAGASFRVWRSGRQSLHVGVFYSSRGELGGVALPLPMFAYRYMKHDLFISIGLPMFMIWRPAKTISLVLRGVLPGVGNARLAFKLHENVSLALNWSVKRDIFYLTAYPFQGVHDLRYLTYSLKEVLNYDDESEENKKFVLRYQRIGCSFEFNVDHLVTFYVYNGFQFNASYYMTDRVLTRTGNGDRIGNSYVFMAGARGFLRFGKSRQ